MKKWKMNRDMICTLIEQEHTHGFRILSATLLISEILAANISKYAAHAIRKDRDNGKYATHANSKVCVN